MGDVSSEKCANGWVIGNMFSREFSVVISESSGIVTTVIADAGMALPADRTTTGGDILLGDDRDDVLPG